MPFAGDNIAASDILVRTGVQLRRVANQSIASGGAGSTAISWDTEDEDTDGFWSSGTTVTIPAGFDQLWVVTARVAGAVTGRSFWEIIPVSTVTGIPTQWRIPMDPVEDQATITVGTRLIAGDTFTCGVFHSTGSNVNFTAALFLYAMSP